MAAKKAKNKCSTAFCKNRTPYTHCGTCRSRKSRRKDPVKYAFQNIKNRAKQRGKSFSLTLEEFRKFCVKTKYIAGKGRSAESYTIDRIDNDKGYSIDNIQVLTKRDNVIKMHLSYDWQTKTATVLKPHPSEQKANYF